MRIADKISKWFLWFLLYSFAGWVYESILFSIALGHWVNRGFLYGPLCPIYGTGAMLALLILRKHVKNAVPLFFIGALLATVVEYTTSVVLERLFHQTWWDYSQFPFNIHELASLNIHGRVSLYGAIAFGVMVVLLIKVVHPRIEVLTERIADKTKVVLASVLAGMVLLDLCVTLVHLL